MKNYSTGFRIFNFIVLALIFINWVYTQISITTVMQQTASNTEALLHLFGAFSLMQVFGQSFPKKEEDIKG